MTVQYVLFSDENSDISEKSAQAVSIKVFT